MSENDQIDKAKKSIEHVKILKKIAGNYETLEANISSQLNFSVEHDLTTGTFREGIWKQLFEQIVPKKFSVEQSVFIVDSNQKVSREVDLAIFDEQYTPYIFRYGNMKYIPIEAVAVVVQCKSKTLKEPNLSDWVDSINILKTSMRSIARQYSSISYGSIGLEKTSDNCGDYDKPVAGFTQSSTRPIFILCHTGHSTSSSIQNMFDFTIYPDESGNKLKVGINKETTDLYEWHKHLNHTDENLHKARQRYIENEEVKNITLEDYKVFDSDSGRELSILSLIFQLNQLLMLLNNPMQFPHLQYVKMFNEIIKNSEE